MIVCGWCHAETAPGRCSSCGRDPALPWTQRAEVPPSAGEWQRQEHRQRIAQARRELGTDATLEQIATRLNVAERTVRRWLEMSGE